MNGDRLRMQLDAVDGDKRMVYKDYDDGKVEYVAITGCRRVTHEYVNRQGLRENLAPFYLLEAVPGKSPMTKAQVREELKGSGLPVCIRLPIWDDVVYKEVGQVHVINAPYHVRGVGYNQGGPVVRVTCDD